MLKPAQYSQPDAVHFVLQNCAIAPLLTKDQEITYGRQIRAMMAIVEEQGFKEPHKACRRGHEQVFAAGLRSRDKMVRSNLKLVVSIAKKFNGRCTTAFSFEDMIQEGTTGLSRAAEKFNPEQGYKFSTYATWWIRQAISRGIAQQGKSVRIPVHLVDKLIRIRKAEHLAREQGRAATEEELNQAARGFGKKASQRSEFTARDIVEANRSICSLDYLPPGKDRDDRTFHSVLSDPHNNWDSVEQQEARDHAIGLLSCLNRKERLFIEYLFEIREPTAEQLRHLKPGSGITNTIAAKLAGIPPGEAARRTRTNALRKLKVAARQLQK
jgi:RNA polymerase sigma factor (sigma-70 family)